jgi:hypothetical protein
MTNKITIEMNDIQAATLDNMLTVHLSQLIKTDNNSDYCKDLQNICDQIQKALGVNQDD